MDEYRAIDPAAQLQERRRANANSAEIDAQTFELEAAQWRQVLESGSARPGVHTHAREIAERAQAARRRADAAHAIAGTSPASFAPDLLNRVRQQLVSMELSHLEQADKLENPDAWKPQGQDATDFLAQARWSLAELEAGIVALRAREQELSALAVEAHDGTDSGETLANAVPREPEVQ